jgi:non-lysosomal glucosylceramidase
MTGFEYVAAIGLLYEDEQETGLQCIEAIRDRYDGRKRNPFNEAQCGHHYARAMASWAAIVALSGFHYSAVTATLTFRAETIPDVLVYRLCLG